MASGLRQENVVECRLVDLEVGDTDALGVERTDDLGDVTVRRRKLDGDAALAETGRLLGKAIKGRRNGRKAGMNP